MNVIQNLNFMKAITELVPKLIQQALWIVVVTTIVGFALAIVIGFLLALGRLSKHKWLVNIIVIFQEIIRGTPLLVQLVYIYYVVPLLIQVCRIVVWLYLWLQLILHQIHLLHYLVQFLVYGTIYQVQFTQIFVIEKLKKKKLKLLNKWVENI